MPTRLLRLSRLPFFSSSVDLLLVERANHPGYCLGDLPTACSGQSFRSLSARADHLPARAYAAVASVQRGGRTKKLLAFVQFECSGTCESPLLASSRMFLSDELLSIDLCHRDSTRDQMHQSRADGQALW